MEISDFSELAFKYRNFYVNCLIWQTEILRKHIVLNPSQLRFLNPEKLENFAHSSDILMLDLV